MEPILLLYKLVVLISYRCSSLTATEVLLFYFESLKMDTTRQISLFEESDTVMEIKKHSSLVQMNNVTTLQQRKAMNSLIWIAKDQLKRNPEERSFSIDLGIIKKLSGINRNDNNELKMALKALVSLVIEYNILGKEKYEW